MDIQKTIDIIEKSEHIAFLFPKDPTLDCLASLEVMARLLNEKEKQIGFLTPLVSEQIPHSVLFKKISSSVPLPKEFIISLDTSVTPVSQLRYEKLENRIDVIFSPKSISLKADLASFKEGRLLCDSAILFGIQDIESIGDIADLSPEFFTETPLINIDNQSSNKQYGEANLINTQKTSLTEVVYEFVCAYHSQPLDKDSATLLLTGILDTTEIFHGEATTANSLLAASELMRLGANLAEARELAKTGKSLNLMQLVGRASVRSREDEKHQTLWSFLTAEDFEKTNTSPEDAPAVLAQIDKEFPPQDIKSLLWQDPQDKTIHALLAGDKRILETLQTQEGGEFQSPYFKLSKTFTSFQEAENQISILLEELVQ